MTGPARHLTLTQRLLALTAVAILPAAVALVYMILATHEAREREAHDLVLEASEVASLELERILSGGQGVLNAIAQMPLLDVLGSASCDDYLANVAGHLPQLRGFVFADDAGRVRCAVDMPLDAQEIGGLNYFQRATAGSGMVVGAYTETADGRPYLPMAVPVLDGERVAGVIVTGLDLDWLGARLRERHIGEGRVLAVADRQGTFIAREPNSAANVGAEIPPAILDQVRGGSPGTVEFDGARNGTRWIVGYQPDTGGSGLTVLAGLSREVALAPVYASTYRSLALAAAGTLLAFLLTWRVGDRLLRHPVRRLLDTVSAWRAGDRDRRTGVSPFGRNELTTLAAAIDDFLDQLGRDRAARAAADAHRRLLLREMNHRIKNLFATVQAVANQTFKDSATRESQRTFGQRLAAMAATNDLLVSENWESADLHDMLAGALRPFGLDGGRFELEGPAVQITSRSAMALTLAAHELCTNAAKYGALSVPEGRVQVSWRVDGRAERARFNFRWIESGGPDVAPPTSAGFGLKLIKTMLSSEFDADVHLEFPRSGLRLSFEGPAAGVLADYTSEENAA